jgi:hypothetical protein
MGQHVLGVSLVVAGVTVLGPVIEMTDALPDGRDVFMPYSGGGEVLFTRPEESSGLFWGILLICPCRFGLLARYKLGKTSCCVKEEGWATGGTDGCSSPSILLGWFSKASKPMYSRMYTLPKSNHVHLSSLRLSIPCKMV